VTTLLVRVRLYVDSTAGVLYINTGAISNPTWTGCWNPVLMLTHKDPEVQVMLGLLENQRDHVMGIAAALAKENAELKARIIKLEVAEPENQDGNAI
jgi:hypothetical protein